MWTLDDLESVYAATGLTPTAGVYLDGDAACPQGALVVHRRGRKALEGRDRIAQARQVIRILGLTRAQSQSFARGFDGLPFRLAHAPVDMDFYELGQAARVKFKPGLAEDTA